jgi:protein O-mannosyl-transferase
VTAAARRSAIRARATAGTRAQRVHRHRLQTLAGALLIAGLSALAYLPSVHGGFILDDNLLLTDNRLIKASDGLYRLWFTTDAIDYWPVTNSTLWLEWRLWQMDSTGYHVTNLLVHIASALLLWATLNTLAIPGAFLAALLFAVHPVNVESVAWIAQRKNLLALLFCLASMLAYRRDESRPPARGHSTPRATDAWYWTSLAAFVLAMLSKGSVAIFPVILLGTTWWRRPLTRRDLVRTAPFFLVSAALVLVNIEFQSRFSSTVRSAGFVERLLGAAAAVWFYLYKALLPINLSFVYPKWHIRPDAWQWWVPLLAALATTCTLWVYRRSWGRPLLFAWGFFCVALAPVMGFTDVGFMEHSLVADHYQHLAIIGVLAVLAAGWSTWRQRARGAGRWLPDAAAAGAVALLAWLTWQQSALYADGITLYRATLETNPAAWFAQNNLGLELLAAGRPQEAIAHFERAVQLKPDYAEAHYNLGRTWLQTGQLTQAIDEYQKALRLKPYSEYHHELGRALLRAGRFSEAIANFQQALQLMPDSAEAESNLGSALLEAGRPQDAIDHYERAIGLRPEFAAAHADLGRALLQLDRSAEAITQFERALRLQPDSPTAHNSLGVALAKDGQLEPAIAQFRQALRLNPDDSDARKNLEEILAMQNAQWTHN